MSCRVIDRMVCRGCILPSRGFVQRRWRTYREIPLEGVIAAFASVTGGRWIDRIPPRCHRAKMRGIYGSPRVSYGVGFIGRLEGGKWVVNDRSLRGIFTAFYPSFYLFCRCFCVLK